MSTLPWPHYVSLILFVQGTQLNAIPPSRRRSKAWAFLSPTDFESRKKVKIETGRRSRRCATILGQSYKLNTLALQVEFPTFS